MNFRKCKPEDLQVGEKLHSDVFDKRHVLVATAGTVITSAVAEKIRRQVCDMVVLEDSIQEEEKTPTIIVPDYALALSNEIKERAVKGVEYIYNNPKSADVVTTAAEISNMLTEVVENSVDFNICVANLKASDDYTFKHCIDVATMAPLIARQMGLSKNIIRDLAMAGILHDIGKVEIPSEILNKPGKLTEEEFAIIKNHSKAGYDILSGEKSISDDIKMGVLMHHEKYDGTGYPLKRKEKQIHLYGRLLSVVDVYDALVTKRPYRDVIPPAEVLDMMMGMANQFDIKILQAFIQCLVLYPNGSKVRLSNDRWYLVTEQNPGYPSRPKVVDIKLGNELDLASDKAALSLIITGKEI